MNGWTGGQYSLYRILLGAGVAARFAMLHPDPLAWVAAALALLLAAGRFDTWAAAGLAGLCLVHFMPYETVLLVLHVAVPPAPYGSWQAAGRDDPGGGWSLPGWVPLAARLTVLGGWAHGLFLGPFPLGPGFVLAHLLAFDPAWIRPRRRAGAAGGPEAATVFYDGHCGLCHRSVRFLIAEDREGAAFRYAPIESEAFAAAFGESERAALPDSIVLALPDGTYRSRTGAFVELGQGLGGFWRALAALLDLVPRGVADRLYDWVSANRTRVFARTADRCPRVPAALADRFLV
jgi:predicted DCC family thiol-disulfide oxidoreductase YuxK